MSSYAFNFDSDLPEIPDDASRDVVDFLDPYLSGADDDISEPGTEFEDDIFEDEPNSEQDDEKQVFV